MSVITTSNVSLPREISGKLKFLIYMGSPLSIIGLCFVLFSSVFLAAFIPTIDLRSFRFNGNEPSAEGKITGIIFANCVENKNKIYEYDFIFSSGGKTITGASYDFSNQLNVGDTVKVNYLVNDPEVARITGMRMAPFQPILVLVIFIFPTIGIIFLITGLRRGKKNLYLVRNGIAVLAKVTRKEATNSSINKQRVYKVYFQFNANGIPIKSFVKTHKIDRVLDEAQERILYDPNKPEEATMVDALPRAVRRFFERNM